MEGQVVELEDTTPKIGRGELRRFLSRIKFVDPPHQVNLFGEIPVITTKGLGQMLPTPVLFSRK